MESNVNKQTQSPSGAETTDQRTVRENVSEELVQLRAELSRIAHDMRMKTKDASVEIKDTQRMLEREAKRFAEEVEHAVDRTQEDLVELGRDLRRRYENLAEQAGWSLN